MAYTKKPYTRETWENVPDPSKYDGDLNSLPRFDADNMNRIENGIENALHLTADDIGALSKTMHITNQDILSITVDGLYYCYSASNVPTELKNGYVRVHTCNNKYRVVCWRPAYSYVEHINILQDGVWLGWVETFTNQGGTISGKTLKIYNGTGDITSDSTRILLRARNDATSDRRRELCLFNPATKNLEECLQIGDYEADKETVWKKVFHTGNISSYRATTYSVSIPNSWVANSGGGYKQTINVSGILATDKPVADIVLGTDVAANKLYLEAWGCVSRITTADGSITLYAYDDKPKTAFNIQLKVV